MNNDGQEGIGMAGVKRDNAMVELSNGTSGAGAKVHSRQQIPEVNGGYAQKASTVDSGTGIVPDIQSC
jgi:membrane-bound inhibitor of C-type lysozyme